jgi:Flp pilus assembly protein TadB
MLITTAPQNSGDEYDKRKKKYAIMMATRAVCVVLAASFYRVSMALALVFVIAGAVLPWCAVLIANDRPPKRSQADLGYVSVPTERGLPSGADDRTVDG